MSLYIVREVYKPNKAETNRLLAYLNAMDQLGIKATVVFFIPDRQASELSLKFKNITVVHYWKKLSIKNRYLKHIMEHIYVRQFIHSLKPGDRVFLSGFDFYVKNFIKRKDIKVFFETTEKPGLFRQFGIYSDFQNKLYLKSCKYLDGISVISTAIKDDFIQLGVPEERIKIINMTVDPSRFEGLIKSKFDKVIAYCGTASNNKDGVDQLIKSFALFSKSHLDYKLYIIGETPSDTQEFSNKKLVCDLGISDKVVFTGVVPAAIMPQMLIDATILALDRPDNVQAKYGFPTKLGEYLLSGNPVVITSVGDIPLFLNDGVSAMLAKPDDPISFAKKLSYLADNEDAAKRIGVEGQRCALQNFNAEIETQKLLEMLLN